jgi:UDP-N-acetylmuramyl pentapeptide phosphotransferase/UDP-N-acetylglucosamine-1-phosphate transferase
MVLAGLGGLFIVTVLVLVALGVQLSDNPAPHSRLLALGLLMLIGGMVFLIAMSERWERRHAK